MKEMVSMTKVKFVRIFYYKIDIISPLKRGELVAYESNSFSGGFDSRLRYSCNSYT
jgi:hypothetical protein